MAGDMKCYSCSQVGHRAAACSKAKEVICYNCCHKGHLASHCPLTRSTSAKTGAGKAETKILKIEQLKPGEGNAKYYKTVNLNGMPLAAYIDLGSRATLLRMQEATCGGLNIDRTGKTRLCGFAGGRTTTLRHCPVTLTVDGVTAEIKVKVVDDSLLEVPMWVGQSFIELRMSAF